MELTGVDISHLVDELAPLVGGKIQKVYQTGQFPLILDIYAREFSYRYVFIMQDRIFGLGEKPEMPSQPLGFAQRLRSSLQGARFAQVRQVSGDRIIEFVLESASRIHLFIELFAKGNIIVTDGDHIIRNVLRSEDHASRRLRPGQVYQLPPQKEGGIASAPGDKHLIALIAGEGFGGKYAQRIIDGLELDRSATRSSISDEMLRAIEDRMEAYRTMRGYDERGVLGGDLALLDVLSRDRPAFVRDDVVVKRPKKDIVEIQSERASQLEVSSVEKARMGRAFYEHYALLEEALAFAQVFRKEHGSLAELAEHWPARFPNLVSVSGSEITLELPDADAVEGDGSA